MNRKYRCGHFILTNDGIIKKHELANDDGSRYCTWNNKNIDFKTKVVVGIAVEQTLVNLTELKINQTGATFRQTPDTNITVFSLKIPHDNDLKTCWLLWRAI